MEDNNEREELPKFATTATEHSAKRVNMKTESTYRIYVDHVIASPIAAAALHSQWCIKMQDCVQR